MRRGLAAAAVSAVVALSFAGLFASTAGAQNAVTITASPITLSPAPGPAGNVATNMLAVTGHFHVDGGFQPTFDWASVNLIWRGKAPRAKLQSRLAPDPSVLPAFSALSTLILRFRLAISSRRAAFRPLDGESAS